MPDFAIFQNRIGYRFDDPKLLELSLTHPSVAHEHGVVTPHNQRLEFLGDAVLGLVLAEDLYRRFPDMGEGPLTKARAHLVNRRTLVERAKRMDLGSFLILSRAEEANLGRAKHSALADAFEAVIGAVLLDGGFEAARRVVLTTFADQLGNATVIPTVDNPKGELQEFLQAISPRTPEYTLRETIGPDHDRVFVCAVSHDGSELGTGTGRTKKEAESSAATSALATLKDSSPKKNTAES